MKFFETSKYHSFKKSTYITLRWIGIIGQLIAVNFVHLFLNSSFDFITSNLIGEEIKFEANTIEFLDKEKKIIESKITYN